MRGLGWVFAVQPALKKPRAGVSCRPRARRCVDTPSVRRERDGVSAGVGATFLPGYDSNKSLLSLPSRQARGQPTYQEARRITILHRYPSFLFFL
jgi:hypothetical protein